MLRFLGTNLQSPSLNSIANAMVIPPIHVDHVAEAVCITLEAGEEVQGVVDVKRMRDMVGWRVD